MVYLIAYRGSYVQVQDLIQTLERKGETTVSVSQMSETEFLITMRKHTKGISHG